MTRTLKLMIVGAPKSGSTALFRYLAAHPALEAHVHREMPFFGRDAEHERGWAYALEKYFPPATGDAPLVAKHTMAMYDTVAMTRIAETTSAVVVAVLRDPVARAHSHYHYARLKGWEDAPTFEEGLARESGRPVTTPPMARDMQYVADGVYAPRLQHLLSLLPEDRRRVYLSSDLRTDARGVCSELFALADLPPFAADVERPHNERRAPRSARLARAFLAVQQPGHPLRAVASRSASSRTLYRARYLVNRLNEKPSPPPILDPRTDASLRERFAEPDAQLADVLGRSLPWRH